MAVAGSLLVNPEGKIALLHDSDGSLRFPRAKFDGEEALERALIELEKTGVEDVKIVAQLQEYEHRLHEKVHFFVFETPETELRSNMSWVDIEEAHNHLVHEEDRQFYQHIKPRLKMLSELQ